MNEIKTVVILAAGSSRRMAPLCNDKPKALLEYKGESLLDRLLSQLTETGIKHVIVTVGFHKERVVECIREFQKKIKKLDIEIVENDIYEQDVNIWSMKLALERVRAPFAIFEADTVMEFPLVQYVTGADFDGKSVWFTCGKFTPPQMGGILRSDRQGKVTDIRIVPHYDDAYKDYSKLTGLMRVGPHEFATFREFVNEYAAKTIKQYYLTPWIDRLASLPCQEGNAEHYRFKSFNRPEEYKSLFSMAFDEDAEPAGSRIEFMEVNTLKHIESYNEQRVQILLQKIAGEGVWTKPLYVEGEHKLVLDGQHRLQVALRLGLQRVPVQTFHYGDVAVWTLRKEERVDIHTVIQRVAAGNIYPYKTVKHKFPNIISECNVRLDSLKHTHPNQNP
ncbi:MAG: NTP transferase domain-containing protein [Verrucomicrobiota bacterium]